jgi:hypothetical protein
LTCRFKRCHPPIFLDPAPMIRIALRLR